MGDAQILVPALATAALAEQVRGDLAAAIRLVLELDGFTADRPVWRAHDVPVVARILVAADDLDRARALVASIEPLFTRGRLSRDTGLAIVAEAEGRAAEAAQAYAEVADGWGAFGHLLAQAQNLLAAGRTLATIGEPDDARSALTEATGLFRRLRAAPLTEEAEHLLAQLPPAASESAPEPASATGDRPGPRRSRRLNEAPSSIPVGRRAIMSRPPRQEAPWACSPPPPRAARRDGGP